MVLKVVMVGGNPKAAVVQTLSNRMTEGAMVS